MQENSIYLVWRKDPINEVCGVFTTHEDAVRFVFELKSIDNDTNINYTIDLWLVNEKRL